MAKKIVPEELVGTKHSTKSEHEIVVLEFLEKKANKYNYLIEFEDTKNQYIYTREQILKKTCKDVKKIQEFKKRKLLEELSERNKFVKKIEQVTSIPKGLKDKIVLGVDLASKSTGITFYKNGSYRSKTIKETDQDFRKRTYEIVSEIESIIEKSKVEVVILETTFLGLNSKILELLCECRGALCCYVLQKHNVELVLIPPKLWKHHYNMPVGRVEQKEFAMKMYEHFTGQVPDSDDMADSYLMTRFAIEKGE